MRIDLTLSNATIYDVNRIDVKSGEEFTLKLEGEISFKPKWFIDNDPVLDIEPSEDGKEITLTSRRPGTSNILIMNDNFEIEKRLLLNVLQQVTPQAAKIEAKTDAPELKNAGKK